MPASSFGAKVGLALHHEAWSGLTLGQKSKPNFLSANWSPTSFSRFSLEPEASPSPTTWISKPEAAWSLRTLRDGLLHWSIRQ